jgi:hypothetical protein
MSQEPFFFFFALCSFQLSRVATRFAVIAGALSGAALIVSPALRRRVITAVSSFGSALKKEGEKIEKLEAAAKSTPQEHQPAESTATRPNPPDQSEKKPQP